MTHSHKKKLKLRKLRKMNKKIIRTRNCKRCGRLFKTLFADPSSCPDCYDPKASRGKNER
jgi:predicted Zn-ribbon and HTH transcriptional regulator